MIFSQTSPVKKLIKIAINTYEVRISSCVMCVDQMLREFGASPPKIIIVEKNQEFGDFLAESFTDAGYTATHVTDYQKALTSVVNQQVDVITSNIEKTDQDGIKFIRNVRKSPKKQVPVVVITGNVDKDLIVELAPLKISKILIKPVDMMETISMVNGLIGFQVKPEAGHQNPEKSESRASSNEQQIRKIPEPEKPKDDWDDIEITDDAV